MRWTTRIRPVCENCGKTSKDDITCDVVTIGAQTATRLHLERTGWQMAHYAPPIVRAPESAVQVDAFGPAREVAQALGVAVDVLICPQCVEKLNLAPRLVQ